MENKKDIIDKDEMGLNLFIPEDMEEINIVGGAAASTPYYIRLVVYNEEFDKTGGFLDGSTVQLVRTGKAEITMPPQVAKDIAKILNQEAERYEEKFMKK